MEAGGSNQQDQPTRAPVKIYVTGFPAETRAADLARAFGKLGQVRVERMAERHAVLACESQQVAQRAIGLTNIAAVHGAYLDVRLYNDKHQDSPKRKHQCTVPASALPLAGDFHAQLDGVLRAVRLPPAHVARLAALYRDLEAVLAELWPGCVAMPFGSITTGLGIRSSDADCFVSLPPQFRHPQANHVHKAKRVLHMYPHIFTEIVPIPRANTPIIKFFHIPTEMYCDVSFKTPIGSQNSKLIMFLLQCDPKLIPIAVLIKYWAKIHELSGTGRLTNYALIMLFIFYLQQAPMCILPSVEWLQRDPANDCIVDFWNTGFINNKDLLPPSTNTSSISELLGGFFEYYSSFNFDDMMVCPYLGYPIKKESFRDFSTLPNQFELYRQNLQNQFIAPIKYSTVICIQDPFDHSRNVASSVNPRLANEIKAYFKFAANAYEKEKLNNCENFLKIILLQRPKITRTKAHPEYRVNLFPKIINSIIDEDWKSVVREVVFSIFEKILKLSLGKVEEKTNPDLKRVKEKYMTTVTRAVWKRKQFSKLYNLMKLDFLEREQRITEEILRVARDPIAIEFQVTITFCQIPKSSVVSMKLTNGDLEIFKDFGRFFVSYMQSWFMTLLKPYTSLKEGAAPPIEVVSTSPDSDSDRGAGGEAAA